MEITDDPQELWVPAKSRANIEQQYFIDKFGPFFRINTLWLTPGPGEDPNHDIFEKPYLEMLYHLQMSIEQGRANVNDVEYEVLDFCYKPITGKGCIVTSPMEYWRANLTRLQGSDVKKASKCEAEEDTTDRVCFDRIGVPVLQFAIFGGLSCVEPRKNECSQCAVKAPGL
jgi:Niemann-Pick C1 protein